MTELTVDGIIAQVSETRRFPPRRRRKLPKFGAFLQRGGSTLAMEGKGVKSTRVRVAADFATYLRREAKKHGITITEVTRHLSQFLNDKEL